MGLLRSFLSAMIDTSMGFDLRTPINVWILYFLALVDRSKSGFISSTYLASTAGLGLMSVTDLSGGGGVEAAFAEAATDPFTGLFPPEADGSEPSRRASAGLAARGSLLVGGSGAGATISFSAAR